MLPMKEPEKFKTLGIRPPKGVLMYGPPGAQIPLSSVHMTWNLHRHRQDPAGESLRRPDQRLLPQARRSVIGAGALSSWF